MSSRKIERKAFALLIAGATGIGFAPIFVRLSEVGPVATAGYRILLALPILWFWAARANGREATDGTPPAERRQPGWRMFVVAGLCFAGDLAFWHWSIKLTTIANSTLLTNFAPFFVMLGARFWFSERITRGVVAGAVCAFIGGIFLVGSSVQISRDHVVGDGLALVTAIFYAGYLLSVKFLRRESKAPLIMARSGVVSCAVLFVIAWASNETLWPQSGYAWLILGLLALISHVGGQTSIAQALAHLPASFSSVSLLFQPVVAVLAAAALLHEKLTGMQIIGGIVVLIGIGLAGLDQKQ